MFLSATLSSACFSCCLAISASTISYSSLPSRKACSFSAFFLASSTANCVISSSRLSKLLAWRTRFSYSSIAFPVAQSSYYLRSSFVSSNFSVAKNFFLSSWQSSNILRVSIYRYMRLIGSNFCSSSYFLKSLIVIESIARSIARSWSLRLWWSFYYISQCRRHIRAFIMSYF